jgi:hypothetical protein
MRTQTGLRTSGQVHRAAQYRKCRKNRIFLPLRPQAAALFKLRPVDKVSRGRIKPDGFLEELADRLNAPGAKNDISAVISSFENFVSQPFLSDQ